MSRGPSPIADLLEQPALPARDGVSAVSSPSPAPGNPSATTGLNDGVGSGGVGSGGVGSGGGALEAQVVIRNPLGLHARPAMSFVDTANAYRADIRVHKGSQSVDGKSIMQMMMLAATQGTALKITAAGPDAADALAALTGLVERQFDEAN